MKRRTRRGGIAIYTLLAMVVLLGSVLSVSGLALTNMSRARTDRTVWQAFQAAQAGLELHVANKYSALSATGGRFESQTIGLSGTLSTIAPGVVATAVVQPLADPRWAYITSTATLGGVSRSVRSLVGSRDVGIWNNAIFAGTGAAGQSINGNVDIRGSVHILGEGEAYSDLNGNGRYDPAELFTDKNNNGVWDPGEPFTDANGDGVWNSKEPYNDTNGNGMYDQPLTETDLSSSISGNAYIGNNYSGMPVALEAMVPTAPRISTIETLSAEVRCKHGRVSIGGNAKVGTNAVVDGGTSKSKIDGSYVSDGYTGNQGAASVYSDNGTSNSYDLGALGIKFPIISGIGATSYVDSGGTTWTTQENYLDARSLSCPVTLIKASTTAFTYGPDAYGNRISFTPAAGNTPAKLTVTGIVKFGAALQIGSKDSIRFDGKGTIYCPGSINIDGDFLPVAGKIFPTQTGVGFIAKQNINLATGNGSSQLSLAGAFYAQGKIVSRKQNQVAGTFVSNFFDMGTNVPNIYQVPELVNNLPPGMPGEKRYFTIRIGSWRERLVH